LIYKKLPHIEYDKENLLSLANSLKYNKAYHAIGREIPQEIHPTYGFDHPLIQDIIKQFTKQPFYNTSFIRTAPHTIIAPHTDSGGHNGVERTVNILFPLDNYVSPLSIHIEDKTYTVDVDTPVAFPCSELHSYENKTDGYRTAFILQCKKPFDMKRLEWMGVI
jgi:hypothetical protein